MSAVDVQSAAKRARVRVPWADGMCVRFQLPWNESMPLPRESFVGFGICGIDGDTAEEGVFGWLPAEGNPKDAKAVFRRWQTMQNIEKLTTPNLVRMTMPDGILRQCRDAIKRGPLLARRTELGEGSWQSTFDRALDSKVMMALNDNFPGYVAGSCRVLHNRFRSRAASAYRSFTVRRRARCC